MLELLRLKNGMQHNVLLVVIGNMESHRQYDASLFVLIFRCYFKVYQDQRHTAKSFALYAVNFARFLHLGEDVF